MTVDSRLKSATTSVLTSREHVVFNKGKQDRLPVIIISVKSMSLDNGEEAESLCCASCGIKENDDIKLKKCNGCHLVRYCGVECQKEHRPKHKKECKKRAAELYEMSYYSSNRKAAILGTVRSALYLCRLICRNRPCMIAAANSSAMAAVMQIKYESSNRGLNNHVHSAANLHPTLSQNRKNEG